MVFLGMVLFTAQALLDLYATSMVTTVAYDAAREVAGSDGGPAARASAEARARRLLGRFGDDMSFDWSASSDEDVVLRVQGDVPRFTLANFPGPSVFASVDRTVRVRGERFRA